MRENHDWRYAKWIKSVAILSHIIKPTSALSYLLLAEWPKHCESSRSSPKTYNWKKVKQKVDKLHLNDCGEDVQSSCLECWTKVKKLTVPMRNRMSNLLISSSVALPLGHRDPTMSYAIIRIMVDTRLSYSYDKRFRKRHMRIRTRRDEKTPTLVPLSCSEFTIFLIWKVIRRS